MKPVSSSFMQNRRRALSLLACSSSHNESGQKNMELFSPKCHCEWSACCLLQTYSSDEDQADEAEAEAEADGINGAATAPGAAASPFDNYTVKKTRKSGGAFVPELDGNTAVSRHEWRHEAQNQKNPHDGGHDHKYLQDDSHNHRRNCNCSTDGNVAGDDDGFRTPVKLISRRRICPLRPPPPPRKKKAAPRLHSVQPPIQGFFTPPDLELFFSACRQQVAAIP